LLGQAGRRPIAGIVQGIARAVYPKTTASRGTPGGEGVFSRVQPTFDFVQLAQRFPVRIIVKDKEFPALRMGGKAAVVVDTQSQADSAELREYSPREAFLPPAGP
jgi:multidrug resistance efflux pump